MGLFDSFWTTYYGNERIDWATLAMRSVASGLVWNSNPPYTVNDVLAMYPKFFGTPVAVTGTLAAGNATVTNPQNIQGVTAGQLVTGTGIPCATLVQSVATDSSTLTLSQNATADGESTLSIYTAPPIPLVAIQMYVNLAQASLMQARWCEAWPLAMALFVAHYCTLYARSESGPNSTAAQIAASGLEKGIIIASAVGDVSKSSQVPSSIADDWGTFGETSYGAQLATMAATVGMGPIWVG